MPTELKNAQYKATSGKKGVLGTLEGPCADTISATRNGRKYSEELWEKAFNDPIVEEYFENGGIFGELGHPADRSETDLEKIAICMPEKPSKGPDGKLYGRWDILDTPNGRILKCLCDYGYKIGISSRGDGEVNEDYNGEEVVDPDSYELNAFDAVLLPAVKEARLTPVGEALSSNKALKVALTESFRKATADDKKIMKESLDRLHIDIDSSSETEGEPKANISEAKEVGSTESPFKKSLQEALRNNRELQKNINSLNEKLSVSYAKESKLKREKDSLQEQLDKLSPVVNASKSLRENFINSRKMISSLNVKLSEQQSLAEKWKSRFTSIQQRSRKLAESLKVRDEDANRLKDEVVRLSEELNKVKSQRSRAYNTLREDYQSLKHESTINEKSAGKKLNEALEETSKYKKMFNEAFEKYLECKSEMIGVSVEQLKSSIKGSKSYKEIDRICEDLSAQRRNFSKLPFPIDTRGNKEIFTKSEDVSSRFTNPDDTVDESLMQFIN